MSGRLPITTLAYDLGKWDEIAKAEVTKNPNIKEITVKVYLDRKNSNYPLFTQKMLIKYLDNYMPRGWCWIMSIDGYPSTLYKSIGI